MITLCKLWDHDHWNVHQQLWPGPLGEEIWSGVNFQFGPPTSMLIVFKLWVWTFKSYLQKIVCCSVFFFAQEYLRMYNGIRSGPWVNTPSSPPLSVGLVLTFRLALMQLSHTIIMDEIIICFVNKLAHNHI